MSKYPQDGSTFVVETIDRTAYKWAKYNPDGVRQMGVPGRWQKQVWSGDWFKWENCAEPEGELSPPIEDGPISKAFKEYAALKARVKELEKALEPFAMIADLEHKAADGDTVMVNVSRCRDARTALKAREASND